MISHCDIHWSYSLGFFFCFFLVGGGGAKIVLAM